MKGTFGLFRGHALLTSTILCLCATSLPVSPTAASTVTTSTSPASVLTPTCGVVASSSVRIISKSEPCVVTTHVGVAFDVELRAGFKWHLPVTNSRAVSVSAIALAPIGQGTLVARVKARRAGTALISSSGVIVCTTGQACPELALYWALRIVVTGSSSTSAMVALNNMDSGRHYTVHVGDRLNLALVGLPMYWWTEPTSSRQSVLARTGGSNGHRALANFVATAPGRVSVMAVENPNCSPECLPPTHLFQVIVIVTH
ncbi:MAG: hypothetical protein ABI298_03005 [Acidimicrobiales bacterium]